MVRGSNGQETWMVDDPISPVTDHGKPLMSSCTPPLCPRDCAGPMGSLPDPSDTQQQAAAAAAAAPSAAPQAADAEAGSKDGTGSAAPSSPGSVGATFGPCGQRQQQQH